jgi:D-proline reductase (dithiol) PrdB
VCLVARRLEEAGIATVVMGSALDIVEACGAPRFLFSDFPLGSACGRPFDRDSQRATLELALDLLESACGPATLRSPLRWSEDPGWKRDYASVEGLDETAKARLRETFEREKRRAREGPVG